MTATANYGMFLISSPQITGLSAGKLPGPQTVPAHWLGAVERRIRDSIVPTEHIADNDGRWLAFDVANAAIQFFRQVSALLPGEPYIYSSAAGDLVAEFNAMHGQLTSVVTVDKLLAVAMVDGRSEQLTINLANSTGNDLLRKLKPMADLLCKGQHAGSAGT